MASINPKTEYALAFTGLTGGLNLWDAEYQLKANESPEMRNLLWKNGMLSSRKGQQWVVEEKLGTGYAMYERVWNGYLVCHIRDRILAFPASGEGGPSLATVDEVCPAAAVSSPSGVSLSRLSATAPSNEGAASGQQLCSGLPEIRGTFFVYGDKLYYKTTGTYKVISLIGDALSCSDVAPYVPVILINASPTDGSGDLYQPENRMSPRKTVWYNAQQGVITYKLPVAAKKIIEITVDGVKTTAFSYNSQTGTVRFITAPPVTSPATNNTVHITYELANEAFEQSIASCRYAATYGGAGALCVCFAGYDAQPNAMFWNGQNSLAMDPAYFPAEQFQLCGETDERILGFGRQQSELVIFKEHSVGKVTMSTVDLNGRLSIDMPYTPVNARIGCRFPWSIQLVENNLVWANNEGVFTLLDTTAALENTVLSISKKINPALLADLGECDEDSICSLDDDHRYYLTCSGKTYAWDYELSSYKAPSWFPLTNTNAIAYCYTENQVFHLNTNGQISCFSEELSDYGEPIERLYSFATLNFGSYDCLKNVNSVIVILGADSESETELIYRTDYESRADLTPLKVIARSLHPAVFRRRPMCRRVQHFTMLLKNANKDEDLQLIGAQIFYNLQGRFR